MLQFFCYSHLISVLCRTAYALRCLIRVHSRPFVAKKFDLFLTNRCLFSELSVISCSKFCLRGPAVNRERPRKTAKDFNHEWTLMDTNIAVLLFLAFDFGAMPHCVLSEVSYSHAFASIGG